MVGDITHVFMLGVIFEVSVECMAEPRPHDIEQPGKVVVEPGHDLGNDPIAEEAVALVAALQQLFDDQQVEELVVLLLSDRADFFVDAAGEVRGRVRVGDRDVGDVFPGDVRDSGDDFEHSKLAQRTGAAVDEVHGAEQRPGGDAGAQSGRFECGELLESQLVGGWPWDRFHASNVRLSHAECKVIRCDSGHAEIGNTARP